MSSATRTNAVVFPFDLFGNSGTAEGALLLGDLLREVQDDTRRERRSVRADCYVADLKIQEVPFDTLEAITSWRETGRRLAAKSLANRDFLLWLGGNHLSVLPLYEELGPKTLVIQFDAHLDIYHLHDTTQELSHGNFLLHAETPLPRIVNVGHRDLFLKPKHVLKTFESVFAIDRVNAAFGEMLGELRQRCSTAERVWIDLDVDVLDPQFVPAVCQPMPFGLTPPQFLALWHVILQPNVVGVSISEFAPGRDRDDASLNLLGWLVEWILLRRWEGQS